jgi:hypothetical protein
MHKRAIAYEVVSNAFMNRYCDLMAQEVRCVIVGINVRCLPAFLEALSE